MKSTIQSQKFYCLLNKEIDILANKIQHKLNIEQEEGKSRENEMELLLGDNPSKESLKDYMHKKYKVRMQLIKQKLQNTLFSKLNKSSR